MKGRSLISLTPTFFGTSYFPFPFCFLIFKFFVVYQFSHRRFCIWSYFNYVQSHLFCFLQRPQFWKRYLSVSLLHPIAQLRTGYLIIKTVVSRLCVQSLPKVGFEKLKGSPLSFPRRSYFVRKYTRRLLPYHRLYPCMGLFCNVLLRILACMGSFLLSTSTRTPASRSSLAKFCTYSL